MSGSWDGTIRAWDIRRAGVKSIDAPAKRQGLGDDRGAYYGQGASSAGPCIAVMRDHVADVYGLSAADERPFLYTSASRDTTVRHFILEGVVSSLKTRALVDNSLAGCLGEAREAMHEGSPARLCGQASRALQARLHQSRHQPASTLEHPRSLFDFFGGPDGVDDFWEVMRWVAAKTSRAIARPARDPDRKTPSPRRHTSEALRETRLGGASEQRAAGLRRLPRGLMFLEERVMHRNARRAWARSLAERLELSPSFLIQDRRLSRSDRLARAARLYLAAGDLVSSCEALVKLGRWESALCVAPAIGARYWLELAERYRGFLLAGRDRLQGGGGGGGGESRAGGVCSSGPDDAIDMAPYMAVATGRPLQALGFLTGTDEALALAASVAEEAFPAHPTACPPDPRGALFSTSGESAEPGQRGRTGSVGAARAGTTSTALAARPADDAKSPALPNESGAGAGAHASEGIDLPRDTDGNPRASEGGEALPRADSDTDGTGTDDGASRGRTQPTPGKRPPTQAELGEEALRSMTESMAGGFFRASQSALAAASLLSLCDGTREPVSQALSLLVRAEEPELAYAAAKALRFPERELRSLLREMARRAEASGDATLAVQLLLDAGGEDDHDGGSDGLVRGTSDRRLGNSGHWPAGIYGAAGEEPGPRGVAGIASRANLLQDAPLTPAKGSPSHGDNKLGTKLRSKSSYLEDAESALRRGITHEAVRLLVLGGDLERAAKHGILCVKEALCMVLQGPSPRQPLVRALAVIRALSSGPPLGRCLSRQLQQQVLAYASYLGAIEAGSRGYHPVVVPLLRNAFLCARVAESLESRDSNSQDHPARADEKTDGKTDASPEHGTARRPMGTTIRNTDLFPPWMSSTALVSATARYVAGRIGLARDGAGVVGVERAEARERERDIVLGMIRGLRVEKRLPDYEIRRFDAIMSGGDPRGRLLLGTPGPSESASGISPDPAALEHKHREDDAPAGTPLDVIWSSAAAQAHSILQHPRGGEIIVSGSCLPSCQRHKGFPCHPGRHAPRGVSVLGGPANTEAEHPIWPFTRGAAFLLEDKETSIGLSNAVMWAKVNPFSPLNTGYRIMPF